METTISTTTLKVVMGTDKAKTAEGQTPGTSKPTTSDLQTNLPFYLLITNIFVSAFANGLSNLNNQSMGDQRTEEELKTNINVFIRARPLRNSGSCIESIEKDDKSINRRQELIQSRKTLKFANSSSAIFSKNSMIRRLFSRRRLFLFLSP